MSEDANRSTEMELAEIERLRTELNRLANIPGGNARIVGDFCRNLAGILTGTTEAGITSGIAFIVWLTRILTDSGPLGGPIRPSRDPPISYTEWLNWWNSRPGVRGGKRKTRRRRRR